jgi:hypothetical protein
MLQQELLQKQAESDEKLKENGFKAVRKLLAENYMIRSLNDIMDAIAETPAEEKEEAEEEGEEDDESTRSPAEIREHIKEIVEDNEKETDNA